jgi:hypothetical protein
MNCRASSRSSASAQRLGKSTLIFSAPLRARRHYADVTTDRTRGFPMGKHLFPKHREYSLDALPDRH